MTPTEAMQLARSAATSCHNAMKAIIAFNLMVDVTDERVSVKGMKAGLLQGTNLEFLDNDKETIVRLAIAKAAIKEVEHGDA